MSKPHSRFSGFAAAGTIEAHLRDGSVQAGRLLRVTAEAVVIEPGSHPRAQVAWLHLGRAAEPVSPAPPGSAEHLYDAVIVVTVVERLDYRDDHGSPHCDHEGPYRPHVCTRSLTGKPLSIVLGWSPQTGRVMASNGGPDIDGFVEDICSSSYLQVKELQPDWAPTQFSGSRALFDGVAVEPTAEEVERLRAGEEVILRGGVRFKELIDCCVGNTGFVRIGAEFDVRATAEIRLTPRR